MRRMALNITTTLASSITLKRIARPCLNSLSPHLKVNLSISFHVSALVELKLYDNNCEDRSKMMYDVLGSLVVNTEMEHTSSTIRIAGDLLRCY